MTDELEREMHGTYSRCKAWWRWVLVSWFASAGLAGASSFVSSERGQASMSVAGLVLAVVTYGMRWRADALYQTAEGLRRMRLISDGLGEQPHPAEAARIRARASDRPSNEPPPIGAYYTSPFPQGWRRVLHNVMESAFYTEHLARRTAWFCLMSTVCVVAAAMLALAFAAERMASPVVANAALGVTAAVIGGTLADLSRAYFGLAGAAASCVDRAKRIVELADPPEREAVETVGDYNIALAGSPPIPALVYRRMQARLDVLWRHVRAA